MNMQMAAERALGEIGQPTHVRDLCQHMEQRGLFTFGARNPVSALGPCLDRGCVGVSVSRPSAERPFYRHAPATYGLVRWLPELEVDDLGLEPVGGDEAVGRELDASLFLERELQRWLYKNLQSNGLAALGYGPLRLYDEERQASSDGKYWTGEVGEMDMLLVAEDETLVVVELKRRADDQTIGQICRYVGWASQVLAKAGQAVEGIILAQTVSPAMRFAIQATKENIRFQELRIDVSLGDRVR